MDNSHILDDQVTKQPEGQEKEKLKKKKLERNENGNTAYQNLWDAAKFRSKRELIAVNASKLGKLSSGHRTGKGQFSLQCQRLLKLPQNCVHLTR